MNKKYRITISNENFLQEIQLPTDKNIIKIGTEYGSDIRLYQDDFITDFELMLQVEKGVWSITCMKNTFLGLGDAKKVINMELSHGMEFDVCAQSVGAVLFHVEFSYDFDWENKYYDGVIYLRNAAKFVIGTTQNAEVVLLDGMGLNECIEFYNQGQFLQANVHSSAVGFRVNGSNAGTNCRINDRDFFSIAHFSFYYCEGQLYIANSSRVMVRNLNFRRITESSGELQYPRFNLNPHFKTVIPDEDIQILDPPAKPKKEETSLWASLLPSLAMLVMVIVVRGFMGSSGGIGYILFSVCSMSIGIVTTIVNYNKGKKNYAKQISERENDYNSYIQNKTAEIQNARANEAALLNQEYPNVEGSVALVQSFSGDLFDRTELSEDFLKIRLGLGNQKAIRKISYAKKEKIIPGDEIENLPIQLEANNRMVENVPIVCDLKQVHNLGIVGSEKSRYEFLKLLVLDLCAHHYYQEVQLFFCFRSERSRQMNWVRSLPHVQKNGRNIRNIVCDDASQVAQFEYLYKELSQRKNMGNQLKAPWIIILCVDDCGIFRHPISKFIKDAHLLRVHFIFFEKAQEHLPLYCGEKIILQDDNLGMSYVDGAEQGTQFGYQHISDEQMSAVALKLAPVYCDEVSLESALTSNITLFELLDIYSVEDLAFERLWKQKDIGKTMAAPLGVNSKNEIVYLDLHEKAHGPHGLVAGTTGSGKSELLQTYILSMAVQYQPTEVGFVLIDFKGGGMANQFRDLPHLIGAITDIDGREINRSLLSIRAELDRRKELFAQADVNSITKYIEKYKKGEVGVPLPHLIIIVDEFAELKAEQPEFMKELISASRIGRSLGVHLILATQKPAGQVSDQIWSNSKFKICLKVQSQSDSNEVIKSPLAAEIKEPGRAYMQVGNNEIFELVQSAYSGGPERREESKLKDKKFKISRVDLAGRRQVIFEQKPETVDVQSRNQLQAIVSKLSEYCSQNQVVKVPDICLPPLPKVLAFPAGIKEESNPVQMQAEIGLYDAPAAQYQGPAVLQLAGKNTIIIGASQSGKTNLLQNIIRMLATKYTPKDVNIYILDFASMFLKNYESLPHVGGVVTASESEKFRNLFKLLYAEIVSRKDKMVAAGVSSFNAYREAGYMDIPYIVLMIDNFTAVKETYFDDEDELLPICREGASVGISVIISNAQTAGFGYRYFSTISNQVVLHCNEEDEISNVFGYCRERPDSHPGSCLIQIEKEIYHGQTWLAFEGKREIDRSKEIHSFIDVQKERCKGQKARQIPQVPDTLSVKAAYEFGVPTDKNKAFAIGVDYEDIETVTLDFEEQFMLALMGEKEDSKKAFLDTILQDIRDNMFERSMELYIVDSVKKSLKQYADMPYVARYTAQAEEFVEIVTDLAEVLQERMELVAEDEKALEKLPLLMVIVNTRKAIEALGTSRNDMKVFDRISQDCRNMKILFLFAEVENTSNVISGGDLMKRIRDERKAIIFGSLKNSKLFEFALPVVRQKNHPLGNRDAFYLNKDTVKRTKLVEE